MTKYFSDNADYFKALAEQYPPPHPAVIIAKEAAHIESMRTSTEMAALRDRAEKAEQRVAELEGALAFYADLFTYEQVDILGQCGLSDDRDENDDYGKRARAALAGKVGQ